MKQGISLNANEFLLQTFGIDKKRKLMVAKSINSEPDIRRPDNCYATRDRVNTNVVIQA